jgi:hypothetical protein
VLLENRGNPAGLKRGSAAVYRFIAALLRFRAGNGFYFLTFHLNFENFIVYLQPHYGVFLWKSGLMNC